MATDVSAHTETSLQAKPATAIKVVGLPAAASRQDVVNFFSGIETLHGAESVTIVSEQDASTSAIVQLANPQARLQAISRSHTLFGDIPVQVLPYNAVQEAAVSSIGVAGSSPFTAQQQGLLTASQHEQPGSIQQPPSFPFDTGGSTLKLRGLPYSAVESDVIAFFEGGATETPVAPPDASMLALVVGINLLLIASKQQAPIMTPKGIDCSCHCSSHMSHTVPALILHLTNPW